MNKQTHNIYCQTLDSILSTTIFQEKGIYSIAFKELFSGLECTVNPRQMRSASLIKLFIMVEAFNQSLQNNLDLSEVIKINPSDKVGGAGSLEHAPDGTVKTILELVELMIIESDNTATNILIEILQMNCINTLINSLNCHDTILQRKMMDFVSAAAGRENYTSTKDIILLLEKLYRHQCLGTSVDTQMIEILKKQEDKCKLPVFLPPGTIIAHKTGELDGAEHDAGIVYGPDTHYVICIMTDDLPDAAHGINTICKISKIVFEHMLTFPTANKDTFKKENPL